MQEIYSKLHWYYTSKLTPARGKGDFVVVHLEWQDADLWAVTVNCRRMCVKIVVNCCLVHQL